MKALRFAIIGAGTAGLALARMLAQQDIAVTIFEKAKTLDPVGAGLLLQPSGLAVFEHLGVLDQAIKFGAKVTGLEGQLPSGQLIVDSHYTQANAKYFGIGIHRATLCHILQIALTPSNQVQWCMQHDVINIRHTANEVILTGKHQQLPFEAAFDAVIIANGARSTLRPSQWVKLDRPYPWGAAWSIVPECPSLNREILHQFYDRANIMMGVLPTGSIPQANAQRLSSVFWSLPTTQLNHFLQQPKSVWLAQIQDRWPIVAEWLQQLSADSTQPMQWLSAHYRDVVMSQYGEGRIGVIGDAAHAMSPQLGQGANMALLDAWALSQALKLATHNRQIEWSLLWQHYHQLRRSSIFMYQSLSRLLTPLYQSELWWAGSLRNIMFSWMYRVPYLRKEMAITISGLKTNLLQQIDYAEIARK
ncbi:MAG: FAD-dependent monooxygenase [Acinetobacter populi]|jgi:2-polyprenyl-6-methoxyphenol hydroxylase-like FAD-dependent oxidoreductase|uniref:FAD-dependent oxidoreductase n=1 Tax=Acinetobacter populi TaxID=1582270 RepID=UPI0023528383|nr:NAD(P)/FAD-dependent oxidoreductase [Acinetobacter populi]MCH4246677.1 FAD-dependent monooxygenase [Acinetobacter populi]